MFIKPKEKISFDNIIKNMMDNVKGKINWDKQHQAFFYKEHGYGKRFIVKELGIPYQIEIRVYNLDPDKKIDVDYEVE